MFFQKVLKGIGGIDDAEAERILRETGIVCNWARSVDVTPEEVQARLTERNLLWHLNHYDADDPTTGEQFYKQTPFISTTAGTVEIDAHARRNVSFPPLLTAIRFATDDYTREGYVFYAYVYTLGKQALPLVDFAEEVRDVHVYTGFLPFHSEGEVVAKVRVPPVRIERFEKYNVHGDLVETKENDFYEAPEQYSNVRESL